MERVLQSSAMQRQRLEADKAHSRNSIQWWTREIEQLHTRIAEARLRIAETDDDLSLIDALAHAVGLRDDATTLMWAVIVEAADAGVSQTDLHTRPASPAPHSAASSTVEHTTRYGRS